MKKQDNELWDILHDGVIADISGTIPGELKLSIRIDYLARLFQADEETIDVKLRNCTYFAFCPNDFGTQRMTVFSQLLRAELDIMGSWPEDAELSEYGICLLEHEADMLIISCCSEAPSCGALITRYEDFSLSLGNGAPIDFSSLGEKCEQYWNRSKQ